MTIRNLLFAPVLLALVSLPACDFLNKTSAQVNARKVIVGSVLFTPAIQLGPEAIADSGFNFDAGTFGDGGVFVTLPEQTAVFAFFGVRNGEGLSQQAPTPVAGAVMSIQPKGGSELSLKEQGNGIFQLTSTEELKLTYQEQADYLFAASAEGQRFVGLVENAPSQEKIASFRPNGARILNVAASSDFSFTRPEPPAGQERNLGFVVVVPISREGKREEPTYSSFPKTPLEYLKLAVAPSDWKIATVKVPGSAFPDKGKNYLIIFQSAKLGRPQTDNLFIGSTMIAGTADVGIVKTH